MTTKQAVPATLDQAQTWIDALRYDLGDAQNECIKVRADNKRLMAEREQLVAALRECIAWGCNEEPGSPVANAKASARALLQRIDADNPSALKVLEADLKQKAKIKRFGE